MNSFYELIQSRDTHFAVLGAIGGFALTYLSSFLIKKREFDLKVWEKLLERRIKAHESMLVLAGEMRIMEALGGEDEMGEIARAPKIMMSRDSFKDWFEKFTLENVAHSAWQSTSAKRELYFIQDYLVNLDARLSCANDEQFKKAGQIIRQDFIDLSSSLEKSAFRFFEQDVRKLSLDSLNRWHKYKRHETERRIKNTELFKSSEFQRMLYEKTEMTTGVST